MGRVGRFCDRRRRRALLLVCGFANKGVSCSRKHREPKTRDSSGAGSDPFRRPRLAPGGPGPVGGEGFEPSTPCV